MRFSLASGLAIIAAAFAGLVLLILVFASQEAEYTHNERLGIKTAAFHPSFLSIGIYMVLRNGTETVEVTRYSFLGKWSPRLYLVRSYLTGRESYRICPHEVFSPPTALTDPACTTPRSPPVELLWSLKKGQEMSDEGIRAIMPVRSF